MKTRGNWSRLQYCGHAFYISNLLSWFSNKASNEKKRRKRSSEGNALISFDVLKSENEKQTLQNLEGFTWLVNTPRFSFNIYDTVRQSWSCQISMKVRNILTHLTLMTTIRQLDPVRFTFRYNLDIAPISFSYLLSLGNNWNCLHEHVYSLKEMWRYFGMFLSTVFPRVKCEQCHLCVL